MQSVQVRVRWAQKWRGRTRNSSSKVGHPCGGIGQRDTRDSVLLCHTSAHRIIILNTKEYIKLHFVVVRSFNGITTSYYFCGNYIIIIHLPHNSWFIQHEKCYGRAGYCRNETNADAIIIIIITVSLPKIINLPLAADLRTAFAADAETPHIQNWISR